MMPLFDLHSCETFLVLYIGGLMSFKAFHIYSKQSQLHDTNVCKVLGLMADFSLPAEALAARSNRQMFERLLNSSSAENRE